MKAVFAVRFNQQRQDCVRRLKTNVWFVAPKNSINRRDKLIGFDRIPGIADLDKGCAARTLILPPERRAACKKDIRSAVECLCRLHRRRRRRFGLQNTRTHRNNAETFTGKYTRWDVEASSIRGSIWGAIRNFDGRFRCACRRFFFSTTMFVKLNFFDTMATLRS